MYSSAFRKSYVPNIGKAAARGQRVIFPGILGHSHGLRDASPIDVLTAAETPI
jgi:hypothetical protein